LGEAADQWSPQISLGTPTLIPESYVSDLQLRLGLYRRLSSLETRAEIDAFQEELVDRFGPLPEEVAGLMDVMEIKGLCRIAGVAQIDAGPKGAVVAFRDGHFAYPEGLVRLIQKSAGDIKLQPDQRVVFRADWESGKDRLKGARKILVQLSDLARRGGAAD
ncbi:MAG: transcription-repair coupling factor, partial [Hyphomicrobiaceae bacterium]|nr:transcription-repair coupling factor [Hyphomicrobiaceae bacterium]